jgi:hypothetical protein
VSSDKYNFSQEMKLKAHKRAELFCPEKSKDVHHIFPKSLAKKYNVPTHLVKKDENAIALERDFHSWIHGDRLTREQFIRLMKDDCFQELFQTEMEIDDCEIEWKGFSEDDFKFLAIALLGIPEEYLSESRVYKRPKKKKYR